MAKAPLLVELGIFVFQKNGFRPLELVIEEVRLEITAVPNRQKNDSPGNIANQFPGAAQWTTRKCAAAMKALSSFSRSRRQTKRTDAPSVPWRCHECEDRYAN